MKEKGKERSQFYYTSPVANFASEGLDASQSIPIKPSIYVTEVVWDPLWMLIGNATNRRVL
jgi:hypothetical protein